MDLKEGSRRLVLTLAWITAILIWIKGFFFAVAFASRGDIIVGSIIALIAGSVTGVICNSVGMWIVKGFLGSKDEKAEIENNN